MPIRAAGFVASRPEGYACSVILGVFELLAEATSSVFGGVLERLGWRKEKRDPRNFPPPR
jgi:hypothetical protein